MRSLIVAFFTFISLSVSVYGQAWKKEFERPKCFIENQGQFDEYENEHTGKIRYAADFGKAKVFFGITGISYVFLDERSYLNLKYLLHPLLLHWKITNNGNDGLENTPTPTTN